MTLATIIRLRFLSRVREVRCQCLINAFVVRTMGWALGRRVVFLGDSVMRYQFLTLVYGLHYGHTSNKGMSMLFGTNMSDARCECICCVPSSWCGNDYVGDVVIIGINVR